MDNRLTVLVPCYNEEATIEKKVRDLFRLAGDIHEVIVVDDHSSDNTVRITKSLRRKYKKLTYLKNTSKKGKASAVGVGIKRAKTDLIAITDADVLLERQALKDIVKQFDNPEVGMVGADVINGMLFHRIRLLLSRIDSLPLLHAQLVVIRKSIGIFPKAGVCADDVDTAIRMRLGGYKTILAPNAWFLQTISDKDNLTKRLRRDGGTITTLWQYRNLLFNSRYGKYGLICFPFCFGLYFIQPLLVVFLLFLLLFLLPIILKIFLLLIILNIGYIRKLLFYDATIILAIVRILMTKNAVSDSWSTVRNQ